MEPDKVWTITVTVDGQPAGTYTLSLPNSQGTEFSAAHLAFLKTQGVVEFVGTPNT